jgi:hypothetical protein
MEDPLRIQTALVAALKLTAAPPPAWIEAASMIPSTVGDLAAIERIVDSTTFRQQFERDPRAAASAAGLPVTAPVLAALRDRLDA